MCYDLKASLEAQLSKARRENDLQAIEEIIEKLVPLTDLPIYHSSGFNHPELLIYTDRSPEFPEVATWGLVPNWVRDEAQLKKLWNSTLNARGETIFEKPSFRDSAKHRRCILCIDGFYEHHHFRGKIYPFFIRAKNKQPISLAGLWSEWVHPESGGRIKTFTIVTTKGNELLTRIHNNPKLKEPRMPLVLSPEGEATWLHPGTGEPETSEIRELIRKKPVIELEAHTVRKLRGREYPGDIEGISDKYVYPELQAG